MSDCRVIVSPVPEGQDVDETGCSCGQLDCDDGDSCTVDTCTANGCSNTPLDCDDGDACTQDSCVAGVCVVAILDCDDGDSCSVDSCEDGECFSEPLDCPDDELFCNGEESCDDGTCVSSGSPCGENEVCNEDDDACDIFDPTAGQIIPPEAMCGATGEGCGPLGLSIILTLLGLAALRFVPSGRRFD